MRRIFAIYDSDGEYAEAFADFARRRAGLAFKVSAFGDEKSLLQFADENRIELLTAAGSDAGEIAEKVAANVKVSLSETPHGGIFKYRPAREVLSDVLKEYAKKAGQAPRLEKRATRVIGVYSPFGGSGASSLTAALGELVCRKADTLVLSLETFPGRGAAAGDDLSDVLFLMRQEAGNAADLIAAAAENEGGADFIRPARFGTELSCFTREEWGSFFEALREGSGYSCVLVDIGGGPGRLEDLLEECDALIVPEGESGPEERKLSDFFEWGEKRGLGLYEKALRYRRLRSEGASKAAGTGGVSDWALEEASKLQNSLFVD